MPSAACSNTSADRVPTGTMMMMMPQLMAIQPGPIPMVSESYAKDAVIAWFKGEFAAANAIIDALCHHLIQLQGVGGSDYLSVFDAIHRRRTNWVPIIQMQKYYSIADVSVELRRVAAKKVREREENETADIFEEVSAPPIGEKEAECQEDLCKEELLDCNRERSGSGEVVDEDSNKDDSPESDITDTGSQELHPMLENVEICSHHADCEARHVQIKITKGFVAKEPVKGHMINVVRGLKLYEDIFTETELSKLTDFAYELRAAGRNGELPGDTFILYNQQLKGNKRELIQLGDPIFGQIKDETGGADEKSVIEPIPSLLQSVIDHLVQWHLISENRKPNGCIFNFFDEGEYSQPFLKPPHLDQPILMLVLSESTVAFGRALVNDSEGNYKAPLTLPLKGGSLLVMRGNSADMARHVMCASRNERASLTFFKVRTHSHNDLSSVHPPNRSMTLWQPEMATLHTSPNGMLNGYERIDAISKWGVPQSPVVMLSPVRSVISNSRSLANGGTGVFLPWTVRSRKHTKHIPPRARRAKLLELPPPLGNCNQESNSSPGISIEGTVA